MESYNLVGKGGAHTPISNWQGDKLILTELNVNKQRKDAHSSVRVPMCSGIRGILVQFFGHGKVMENEKMA